MTGRAVVGGVLSCWFRWWFLSWCQDHGGRWWFLVPVVLVRVVVVSPSAAVARSWSWLSMATGASFAASTGGGSWFAAQDHGGGGGRPHKPPATRRGAQVAPVSVAAVSRLFERHRVFVHKSDYVIVSKLRRRAGQPLSEQTSTYWRKSRIFMHFCRVMQCV